MNQSGEKDGTQVMEERREGTDMREGNELNEQMEVRGMETQEKETKEGGREGDRSWRVSSSLFLSSLLGWTLLELPISSC